MPDNGCDAACIKIIINGGFMAALAPVLVERYGHGDSAIVRSAAGLANAASLQQALLKARGFTVQPSDSFDGCVEAVALVGWIRNAHTDAGPRAAEAAKTMDSWTAAIWQQIADLVAGKAPGSRT